MQLETSSRKYYEEEEEEEDLREIRYIMDQINRLIAYKYNFLSRKQYLQGIIDEKLRVLAEKLEWYGIDGREYIKREEEKWKEKGYARSENS